MQGFPKYIATIEDFENLLSDPEFKEEALEKLEELQNFDDRVSEQTLEVADAEDH